MLFRLSQDPGHLWKRYGVALFIILAFLAASHLIESQAIDKAEHDAAVMEKSGEQRMLSQQIILHAQDLVATNDQAARVKLARTVNAFEAAHTALMADAAREASLGHVYLSRTPSTDEIVRDYIGIARDIPYAKYPEALLDELKAKGSGEVLDRMSEAMIAFEAQVQIQAGWAQRLQTITLLLAVLVIVLEALLIFLPAHRTVDQAMQELRKTAETDPLTKLRNRAGFDKDTLEAMKAREGGECALSLILFDLDDFKGINDRYGQAVGDAVLKRIGYRVSRLPNLLSAARVGGDEFAILVDSDHWGLRETKDRIAEDIQKSKDFLYHPVNHKGQVIKVSGTVGVSRYPVDAKDLDELQRNATTSLLDAKSKGRGGLSIYNDRIDETVKRRRTIQSALMSREYESGLDVAFQPIVQPDTQKIKSVEALARWNHESLGYVNPLEFLSIARECGIGHEVDAHIRALALKQIAPVLQDGSIECVSLNISPLDLAADEFADDLLKQIKTAGVRLDQVWIEVTETERLTRLATARDHLEALSQAGIRIALDDYGVGYSNIRRLAELPIQRLKIDKSIVDNVEQNPKYAGVFRSSVQLARALGAEVVAEGVETAEQLVIVERFGCRLVQGYYFFKPMPIADLKDLFRDQVSSVA
ncbi:MAG: EAL domain-containing protein [Pseudomonadota bacterium]